MDSIPALFASQHSTGLKVGVYGVYMGSGKLGQGIVLSCSLIVSGMYSKNTCLVMEGTLAGGVLCAQKEHQNGAGCFIKAGSNAALLCDDFFTTGTARPLRLGARNISHFGETLLQAMRWQFSPRPGLALGTWHLTLPCSTLFVTYAQPSPPLPTAPQSTMPTSLPAMTLTSNDQQK